jgi:hypothetical protein
VVNAAIPAILGAALLAMAGASFGVVMARMIWADDLKQAQHIDEIRSRTQQHMERQIEAMQGTIEIYKQRLGETP